jgi:prephenate dehydrogenase
VRFLEPAEHDGQVAAVSHLPFLASIALVNSVAGDPSWHDASLLAASGFRDMSRLAGGNSEMYRDICMTNSEAITRWLDEYITALHTLRNSIASRDRNMVETFARAQELRQQWHLSHNITE